MTFSQLSTAGNGMGMLWLTFALEAPLLLLLAWYLEQVTESGIGIRRHWLFPLHALRAWCAPPRPPPAPHGARLPLRRCACVLAHLVPATARWHRGSEVRGECG